MKCFELDNSGRILSGIPEDACHVLDGRLVHGGRVYSAGLLFSPLPGMGRLGHPLRPVLDTRHGTLFGSTHLVQPADQPLDLLPRDGHILIWMDLRTFACDWTMGDVSRLLAWKLDHGLYLCQEGSTVIANPAADSLYVVEDGKPMRLADPSGFRAEHRRNAVLAAGGALDDSADILPNGLAPLR